MRDRVQELKDNKDRLNRYRRAITELRQLGIEEILLELSLPGDIDVKHPRGTELAAAACHVSIGYRKCVSDLFRLDLLESYSEYTPVADFGANEKLGITEETAKEMV